MNALRIISVLLTVALGLSLVGCSEETKRIEYDPSDVVVRSDHRSVWSVIGDRVSVDDVYERDGLAYVTVDGVEFELGMDFLSMAMVYSTEPREGSRFADREEVYNEWFRLYTKRWNYLLPEIPLYSNEYYDVYSSRIENFDTGPYRDAADAIVGARIKSGVNSVVLGSTTKLSGAFRNAAWGKSSAGSADLDVEGLTSGHSTVMTDSEGNYTFNLFALSGEPEMSGTEDGGLKVTFRIREGLRFSDGSEILAKHYLAELLSDSTPVGRAAGGGGSAGMYFEGFEAFSEYGGPVKAGGVRYFSGVRLIDDHSFSLTLKKEYSDYYYIESYLSLTPSALEVYLGEEGDIITDPGSGAVGLNDQFYATRVENGKATYIAAEQIKRNLGASSPYPYSGPYYLFHYDSSSLTAHLRRNPYYTEDLRGKAEIDEISYVQIQSATQIDKLARGEIDLLSGITGAEDTRAVIALLSEGDRFSANTYDRAGYGKLGFRSDFGPTEDGAVRRAIAYTINRNAFAQVFTGGYGSVVHGAYYTSMSAYKKNSEALMGELNTYPFSTSEAIDELRRAGWIYNSKGEEYDPDDDPVRYKRLSGYELSEENLGFRSSDSRYFTVKVGEYYYMPLCINWYGTQPNAVTDLLITSWQSTAAATRDIGMYITYTSTDFTSGLYGEYNHIPSYGYDGIPKLSCINFASGFESAVYDYSFGFTLDHALYDNYSDYYLRDEADYYSRYETEQ